MLTCDDIQTGETVRVDGPETIQTGESDGFSMTRSETSPKIAKKVQGTWPLETLMQM